MVLRIVNDSKYTMKLCQLELP